MEDYIKEKEKEFAMNNNIFIIGQIIIDSDKTNCKITNKTKTSIEVNIRKKSKEGINANQWFDMKRFNNRFKMKNLLEFSIEAEKYLDSITDNFAVEFLRIKSEAFNIYQWEEIIDKKGNSNRDYIVTISLGLEFFKNIIKYWDTPDDFMIDKEKTEGDDYNMNFVKFLKVNKER